MKCSVIYFLKMKKEIILWSVLGLLIVGSIFLFIRANTGPGKLDAFAQCLGEEGAVFYGTFWCPYCKKEKQMFGRSDELLPYIECSTPNGKGQLEVCKEKNITGYPTWEFADGSREGGVISLDKLSEKTGCSVPQ